MGSRPDSGASFIHWQPRSAAWHPGSVLSHAEIGSFVAGGFVAVRGAVPAGVFGACREEIWSALGERGMLREDPSTWRDPVVRISSPESEAFAAAGTQPILWEAFDQLIGEGRWWRRHGADGSILVRFPSQADPGGTGRHIEASFGKGGDWWVKYRSQPPDAGRPTDKHGRLAQRNQLRDVRRRTRTWVIRSTLVCRRS